MHMQVSQNIFRKGKFLPKAGTLYWVAALADLDSEIPTIQYLGATFQTQIRELSFPFMQEPTEKQPLNVYCPMDNMHEVDQYT